MPASELLSYAEETRMPTCSQQVCDELDGVLHVFGTQGVVRGVFGLPYLPNNLHRVREEKLDSSLETWCAGVISAPTCHVTAAAAVRSEVPLRRLQQGCHARLGKDRRAA